jgi:hypothetical protein
VDFDTGNITYVGMGGEDAVRCVRDVGSDADTDTDSDTGMNTACDSASSWLDEETGLCWHNSLLNNGRAWADAAAYCEGLSLGGFNDWRLPKIQELISLIRGCVDGVSTGDLSTSMCAVTDPDCLDFWCSYDNCGQCAPGGGPDSDPAGAYWVPELLSGGDTWLWSSSSLGGVSTEDAWGASYDSGDVGVYGKTMGLGIRCVRSGP